MCKAISDLSLQLGYDICLLIRNPYWSILRSIFELYNAFFNQLQLEWISLWFMTEAKKYGTLISPVFLIIKAPLVSLYTEQPEHWEKKATRFRWNIRSCEPCKHCKWLVKRWGSSSVLHIHSIIHASSTVYLGQESSLSTHVHRAFFFIPISIFQAPDTVWSRLVSFCFLSVFVEFTGCGILMITYTKSSLTSQG